MTSNSFLSHLYISASRCDVTCDVVARAAAAAAAAAAESDLQHQ